MTAKPRHATAENPAGLFVHYKNHNVPVAGEYSLCGLRFKPDRYPILLYHGTPTPEVPDSPLKEPYQCKSCLRVYRARNKKKEVCP